MTVSDAIKGPHYGIMDSAVNPKFQGRGVARMLVQWGLDKAREEGISMELCATPAGTILYEKMGFQKVGLWRWRPGMEGGDGWGGWEIMRWEAS